MTNEIPQITELWEKLRGRLEIEEAAPLQISGREFHALLTGLAPEAVRQYEFDIDYAELATAGTYALREANVPASLCQAFDQISVDFKDTELAEWPGLATQLFGNAEASLESKVSAAELVLLYCPDAQRTAAVDQLASALDATKSEAVPERTKIALGLVGALTGHYVADPESGDRIEFLTPERYDAAVDLLNRWRLRGKLWRKVLTSDADKERDSLLGRLHELHPNANYAGVQPSDFDSNGLADLENRVGRPVLLDLAAQPQIKAWTQHIANLDLGDGQLSVLHLLLEAKLEDKDAIVTAINAKLAPVDQNTFDQNLTNREDGYADLFALESHGIEVDFPDAFYEAAVNVLAKGGLFKPSKMPKQQRERILSGVWSKVVAGHVGVPTSLLRDHLEKHVQKRYDDGGREEFTRQVLPTMIRAANEENLGWAVDFLFARHRAKSSIPDASDAEIQGAITETYPAATGDMKSHLERLASKRWFSLPARPEDSTDDGADH